MQIQEVQEKYNAFIQEIKTELQDKQAGYLKSFSVGAEIFPFAIPPRVEILLLDPKDLTIKFRRVSDPASPDRKKGKWRTGKPVNAVASIIDWANTMKQVAAQTGKSPGAGSASGWKNGCLNPRIPLIQNFL